MAGSKEGAIKARDKILANNPNHFKEIGSRGGMVKGKKGFALSGKAREAGSKGGSKSRRVGTIRVEWNGATVTLPQIAKLTGKEYRDVYQLYKHGRLNELHEK